MEDLALVASADWYRTRYRYVRDFPQGPRLLRSRRAAKPKLTWYFYTVKWGLQDRCLDLFQRNHYPILKAKEKAGRYGSVRTYVPEFHGDGRADWTFAVELVVPANEPATPTDKEIIESSIPIARSSRRRSSVVSRSSPLTGTCRSTASTSTPGSRASKPGRQPTLALCTFTRRGFLTPGLVIRWRRWVASASRTAESRRPSPSRPTRRAPARFCTSCRPSSPEGSGSRFFRMQSEKYSSCGANWSRLPMRLRVVLPSTVRVVCKPFGVFVGRIDMELTLRADDPIRADIGRIEAGHERGDAAPSNRRMAPVDSSISASFADAAVDRDRHDLPSARRGTDSAPR